MPDKIIEKSPAKINLFLKIINKRDDGYHNIRTGITFIDLYDEISVQPHNKFEVIYTGKFAPKIIYLRIALLISYLLIYRKINPNFFLLYQKIFLMKLV